LLDPKRLASASYQAFRSNLSHGTLVTASPETVDGMLESLGALLKLLDITSSENVLPTTYGCLRPPLGKHRLKIVEFISVLLTIGSEIAEKELISQSAIKHCIDLFFQYPYNNFLHHHVENIIVSCLEVKRNQLIDHVLNGCGLVGKVLAAEKKSSLSLDSNGVIYSWIPCISISPSLGYIAIGSCVLIISYICSQRYRQKGKIPRELGIWAT